jgi:hypothetical protein
MREEKIIRIRDFIVNVGQSMVTILRVIILSRFKNEIKKHNKSELIVLGNGPSLNKTITQNKSIFDDKSLMCVNLFCYSEFYEFLKPRHYVIFAPNMWRDNPDIRTVQKKEKLWTQLDKKTKWPLTLYLPFEARKEKDWQFSIRKNKYINVVYVNRTRIEGFSWFRHSLFKIGLGMPRPHNVITPSLYIAINLGFKTITLVGADHSWLPETSVDDHNNVLVCQKHFYDENEAKPEGMIKIHDGSRKLHEVLEKWMISFKSYFILRDYAESNGVKILNATPNSFIDAFERLKL